MSHRSLPLLLALGLTACTGDLPTGATPVAESTTPQISVPKVGLSVSQADAEILSAAVDDALTRVLPALPAGDGVVPLRTALEEVDAALSAGDARLLAVAADRARAAIRALEEGVGPEAAAVLADLAAVALALGQAERAVPAALRAGLASDR